jgi:spore germination protein
LESYNFLLKDENGTSLYAQLSSTDGELISFDYYEHCVEQNLNLDNAKAVAENFLDKLGMENMTAVKVNEMGTTASFSFVYEQDDVVYYPDEIEVKVCEQKGIVIGYNASRYLRHHHTRPTATAKLSQAEAQDRLSPKLQLDGSRVAMVITKRGEKLAYEFICSYDGERYIVYIDAETGDELSIINAGKITQ